MPWQEQKIKVLLVVTKSNWGGAQRYVFDLATRLPKNVYSVAVAFGGHGQLEEKLKENHIRIIPLRWLERDVKIFSDVSVFLQLIRLFIIERPEVVHLNSSKIGGLGALAARLALVKRIIFTVHGWAFNEARPYWQRKLIACTQWLTIILCHQIITISNWEAGQAKRWLGTSGKINVIYNGLAPEEILPRELARRELVTINPQLNQFKLWIGTVAELHPNKGLDFAIQAFARGKVDSGTMMAVIGEGEARPQLERLIEQLNLTDRIFLLGNISEAKKFLSAFDIFILPSRKEGLPYAILEAGLAGLPVVASRVGGIPEIIKHQESGLMVQPGEINDLAQSLRLLAEHPELRHQLGHALQEAVTAKFSLARMLAQTEALYS